MRFSEFSNLEERKVDPAALADRVARRYGKKTSYGQWMKAEKGKHIPLTAYSGRLANAAQTRYDTYLGKLGFRDRDPATREKARQERDANQTIDDFNIKDLVASQQFNRYNDPEITKQKVSDTNPSHIHIITYKGQHIIADGHHAVMAAKLRGEKTIKAKHTNLDVVFPQKTKKNQNIS